MPIPNDSKYAPPLLPRLVSRPRLIEHLRGETPHPLILVVGQAAQGKSTLVADALSTSTSPAVWLPLEPRDGDGANFYHALIRALAGALPEAGFDEFTEQAHVTFGTSEAVVRYEALLNTLWQRLPPDITLVLDSLEQLPPQSPSLELCQHIIDLCAAHGRLIMVSRQTPPFKLQRWIMRRKVRTIDNTELAFTAEEIADYFQTIHQYPIAPEDAAHVMTVTGGWAGGLVLLSQTLGRIPIDQWPTFLSNRFPASLSDDTWLYFAEEIFDALPKETQDILIHAAQLDIIDPEVLEKLVQYNHTAAVLVDLVQQNLFIQTVHFPEGRPLYRLNQLFRQFLQSHLIHRYDTPKRHVLFRKIGEIYQGRRKAEDAIDFFLKAEEPEAAAACIKKAGIDLVIRGRFSDLEEALTALPDHQVQSDPWLFLFLTLTRRIKGGARNIQDFEKVLAAFEEQDDMRGQIMSLAYLIEAQVLSGNAPMACQALNRTAEAKLKDMGDSPYYIYARTLLWLQIGFGYIASGLEIAKGISACQNAYLLAHKIKNPRLMANANIVSVMGLAARGDFELAEEALKKIAAYADTDAYTEYHALRNLVNVELSMRRGDLETAKEQLKPLETEIETFGLLFLYPAFVDATGMLQIYRGEYVDARATCRHLLDVSRLSANAYYEGLSHRLTALRHYYQGRHSDAAQGVERALAVLPEDEQPSLHRMRAMQLDGLIQIHLHQYEASELRLQECRRYYAKSANALSLCETHLSLALLYIKCRDEKKVMRSLGRGFTMAAERQFSHFVILSPDDLVQCCEWAAANLTADAGAWSKHLLAVRGHAPTVETDRRPNPVDSAPASQPQSSGNMAEPYLEIHTLGGFQVLQNGRRPIEDKQWGGNRTKLFFKAILVHGIQDVPKEIIIEDLWPESSPSSAMQNFKVTLHRLRKCLEPDLNRHQRSSYIHLKDNLVSIDHQRCMIDVQAFLQCCKDIRREKLNGETQAIGPLGERLMELYQGDFLPEDPYTPWMEMKRKALQDEYFAALMTTADVFDVQGRYDAAIRCCRAVISLDACMEQAVEKLMALYDRMDRRGDAIKAYTQLKNALAHDLGVAPAAALTELYQTIRSK